MVEKWGSSSDGKRADLYTIEMSPVTDGSPEDKAFHNATPLGKIELSTINPEAAAQFELEKLYYVDFTKAD